MEVHDLYRAELGHLRMPQYYSGGTISRSDIKPDTSDDLIANRLLWLQMHTSWNSRKAYQRDSLDRLCEAHGYIGLWVDPRDYLVHRVGQSFIYDVSPDKRGRLQEFAGQTVRVICIRNGSLRVFVRIGAVGKCHKEPIPRQLGEGDLIETPHVMVRYAGYWPGCGGMSQAFNHGLRRQAAVWYARRYYRMTGNWPHGTHEFIIKYGPTPEYDIRTPIGTHTGYRELVMTFEMNPKGKKFAEGSEEVGANWYAVPIDDLLEGVN